LAFNPYSIDLPVTDIIKSVQQHLSTSNTLIVNAPPGAGKSTLLPLAIFEDNWLQGKKIIMLEPRRLAAKTIALRMASLLGEEVGQTVGYRIRFENNTSDKTKIEVVTEGILTRMIHSDNSLNGVGLVIFDEFHERSIHADVAMALCREAQQKLRPDLRILVMSATLNMPLLTKLLNCSVAVSEGRQYPVEVIYTGQQDEMLLAEMTVNTVMKAVNEKEGDVLVFLPGEGEIRKCEELLRKKLRGFMIHPLYGKLPPNKQFSAIMPDKQGRRKIVLATSIAETSLTIEGIKIVVDTGFGRTSRFDPKSGLTRLETVLISKDSADQRAGRAGRLSAGTCYRMWSKSTQDRMAEHRTPEIMETDLASLVLDMAQWGIMDIRQMTWLTPPPRLALAQATETLHQLNALKDGRITEHGIKIHELPCHPRLAHMLIIAEEDDKLELASDLAAVLEERDPLPREAGIDINERVIALRRFRKENGQGKRFAKIEKIAKSYRKLFSIEPDNGEVDPYETGVLLAFCYPERIAFARPGNNAQFQLANGKYASAHHKDSLAKEPWLAIANLDAREGIGKIYLASPLNPKDLAPLVKEEEVIKWDTEDGELKASKDMRIGSIVLRSKPLPAPDDKHRVRAISDAIKKEGENLLNFDEAFVQWQNRILSLRKWRPEEAWPDVSNPALLMTNWDWLSPYLKDIVEPEDLFELDLLNILVGQLPTEKKSQLNSLAPIELKIEGSTLKIHYQPNGELPITEASLEETKNWTSHPSVNDGHTPLLVHLISSKYSIPQTTTDIKLFWKTGV
jgi:ATP-dependent helicase HrpB